jgi:hypothetical protein
LPQLTDRFKNFPVYPLAHVPARKRELLQRGVDVVDLGAGDADLAPPPAAIEALIKAAHTPSMGRYGFGLGHVPFRQAISDWMAMRFGQRFDPISEIVPLIGSKEGIAHIAFAYLGRGDVAIVPEPAYQAYLGGTLLSHATPYIYPLRPRTSFLVELDEIPRETLDRTRVLYLNYPNNPTAAIAPRDYLERVVRTCRERDIRGARCCDRVPLALQDVQHDGLALRLVGREARNLGGAVEGQDVRRHGDVHGNSGRRRRGDRELEGIRSTQRRDLQGAARRRGVGVPLRGVHL